MYGGLTEVSFVDEDSLENGPQLSGVGSISKGGLHRNAPPRVRICWFVILYVGSQWLLFFIRVT